MIIDQDEQTSSLNTSSMESLTGKDKLINLIELDESSEIVPSFMKNIIKNPTNINITTKDKSKYICVSLIFFWFIRLNSNKDIEHDVYMGKSASAPQIKSSSKFF